MNKKDKEKIKEIKEELGQVKIMAEREAEFRDNREDIKHFKDIAEFSKDVLKLFAYRGL
jgi:adenine-specific DNA methylase